MSHPAAEVLSTSRVEANPQGRTDEAGHDFGADTRIYAAVHEVKHAARIIDLRRAEKLMENAGILAAREARSRGYEIIGWDGELYKKLPEWTKAKLPEDEEGRSYENWQLSQLTELEDRYQLLANLADSYELRRIRQTGSNLIAPDRELRFAMARVEETRQVLDKELAELGRLEQITNT